MHMCTYLNRNHAFILITYQCNYPMYKTQTQTQRYSSVSKNKPFDISSFSSTFMEKSLPFPVTWLPPDHHSRTFNMYAAHGRNELGSSYSLELETLNMGSCKWAWKVGNGGHSGPFEGWELDLTGLKVRLVHDVTVLTEDKIIKAQMCVCERDRTCTSEHPLLCPLVNGREI